MKIQVSPGRQRATFHQGVLRFMKWPTLTFISELNLGPNYSPVDGPIAMRGAYTGSSDDRCFIGRADTQACHGVCLGTAKQAWLSGQISGADAFWLTDFSVIGWHEWAVQEMNSISRCSLNEVITILKPFHERLWQRL